MSFEKSGTFAMIFVGISSIILSEKYPHVFPAIVIPVAWGTIIALMIVVWGSQLLGGIIAIAVSEAIKKL